jgi:DNA-binding CsgD family transcriptional regulator
MLDLERRLYTLGPESSSVGVSPLIRDLLAVDAVALGVPSPRANGIELQSIDASGSALKRYIPDVAEGLRDGRFAFAFSMRAPEVAQRNRPVFVRAVEPILAEATGPKFGMSRAAFESQHERMHAMVELHHRHGIAGHAQLRTLICDGPLVLQYFNAFHGIAHSPRQRRLYAGVLRMLQRRAVLDHRLVCAGSYLAALEATLDALPSMAFVTDRHGRVVHANRLGKARLDNDREVPKQLADAIAGRDNRFTVRPIATGGAPIEYLVVARRGSLVEVARALAAEYRLGHRATEVLELVAAAEPTKLIAVRLGVADNTVEYHLTTVFRRLGVSSRSELQRLLAERALQ